MTGRVIAGRYILERRIGQGAMGVIWRAHDQLLDRTVAVKEVVLSAAIDQFEAANLYRRTLREARTAARLSHPGVVTVYDVVDEDDGRPWIVMELVPSQSLDQILTSQGPLTALRAGRIGQQLLAALAAAHAVGVLHRDVKPSNVLIAPGRSGDEWDERAVLTDFGIAQFVGDPRLTQSGIVVGTLGFMAPEYLDGGDPMAASDLWSLGATIYAAVEGRGPFERNNMLNTMSAILREDPPPLASSAGPLAPLIAALLRREPADRPSASAAARMFTEILALMPDEPAPTSSVAATSLDLLPAEPEGYEIGEPAEPVHQGRDDTQLSVLPALAAPTPIPSPTQSFPPLAARDLLQQFNADTGAPPPRARRVRSRRSEHRGRAITVSVAVIVAIAAASAGSFELVRHRSILDKKLSASATEPISPTASAPRLPPVSGAPAVVKAIDNPNMSDPPDYTSKDFFAAQMGTAAGFTIAWPQGWQQIQTGKKVSLNAPDGITSVEIDLTKHIKSNIVSEAKYLEKQDRAEGLFSGYKPIYGKSGQMFQLENIKGTAGALWEFDWVAVGDVPMREDVLLFGLGQQSYTIYMTGPAGPHDDNWNDDTLPTVGAMLRTFDNLIK
jgi:eukaryotic-like serine/threonine-protein kinase